MSDEQYDELNHEAELDASEEEYDLDNEFDFDDEEQDSEVELDSEEEFEEITSDEVDRVIETLEDLVEGVVSENIRAHLENAVNEIFYLVYDDEDLELDDDLPAEAA